MPCRMIINVSALMVGHATHSHYMRANTSMVGPLLLQDVHMVETLAHFVRERIPERCDFFDVTYILV